MGVRTPQVCLTFAGQSLNGGPIIGLANSYPTVLCASLRAQGVRATRADIWVGGAAWVQLVNQPGRFAASQAGALTIMCQVGGTTDYSLGASGASTYGHMETHGDAARAAGYDFVIGTTTTPSVSIVGGDETKRTDGNALVTASSALFANGGPFDRVVDLSAQSILDAYTDSGYIDQTHFSTSGAALAASLMETAVLSLI